MLLTKFNIPSPNIGFIQRPTLYKKLDEGLSRKLTLVSAPAGYGKSTTVSSWINENKISAAWVSIDTGDNDPVEFLDYLISSIQLIYKDFGSAALELLNSPNLPDFESVINVLINDATKINKDVLLVLDDFHLISNLKIAKILSHLIDYLPENLHLVIISRSDPAIQLARMRSQQQLLEIRLQDLCFSANDISMFYSKNFNIKLSIDDLKLLESKTEGWIAGLQLIALTISNKEDVSEFIQKLKGNNRYIMDYLIEEVLDNLSIEKSNFLLYTSILEQFSADLCDGILSINNSQQLIEQLEKTNMFIVPLDSERKWYRYHHLFADLLKQNLLSRDEKKISEIHKKASVWFEQNDMIELAINHSFEEKDLERCIKLIVGIVEKMWAGGQHSAILKYGEMLPDEMIKQNPEFCLYYSWILIGDGKLQKAERLLENAEKLSKRNAKISSQNKLLGKISVAFSYLESHREHSEKIIGFCKSAMDNLNEDDPFWYGWAWFSTGIAYFSGGNLIESRKAFDNAFKYADKSGNIFLISTVVIRLAESEQQLGNSKSAYKRCADFLKLMQGKGYDQVIRSDWSYAGLYFIIGLTQFNRYDLSEAYESIRIAYELSKKGKDLYLKVFTLIIYSTILIEQKDKYAEEKIRELQILIEKNTIPPFIFSYYIVWQVHLYIETNQLDAADQFILDCGLSLDKEKNHSNEIAYSVIVRLLLRQGKLDKAEKLNNELMALTEKSKRMEFLIEIKTSFAILHKLKGDYKKAVIYLMEALELASKEDYLFFFIIDAKNIKDILDKIYKIKSEGRTKIPQGYLDKLRDAIETREKKDENTIDILLSSRELDALKLMAKDLTNQQIADKLFISLNTVKTHVRKILIKFEVENRQKAILKAKKLKII